jgi:hypothetical protein
MECIGLNELHANIYQLEYQLDGTVGRNTWNSIPNESGNAYSPLHVTLLWWIIETLLIPTPINTSASSFPCSHSEKHFSRFLTYSRVASFHPASLNRRYSLKAGHLGFECRL